MAQQILIETLERLPDIAIANCGAAKIPDVDSLTLPKAPSYLFGHPVQLDSIQQAQLTLSRKQQIITDWQIAAKQVKQMFAAKQFKEPLVVPMQIFIDVCNTCKLYRFEEIYGNNSIFVNPLIIDRNLCIYPFNVSIADSRNNRFGLHWFNERNPGERKRSEHSKPIKNEAIVLRDEDGKQRELFFIINDISIIEDLFWRKKQTEYEYSLPKIRVDLLERIEQLKDPYNLYSMVQKKYLVSGKWDYIDPKHEKLYQGNVVFPDLPKEFQDMLYELKWKFPHFPVYTAADPAFFRLSFNGTDILEYAQHQSEFWLKVFDDMLTKLEYYEQVNDALQRQFAGVLASMGIKQKREYFLTSHEDMLKAIEIEKDPIFYLPVETVHNHVKYNFAVVYGQFGESPNEKAAIEQLEKVGHEAFLGVAAN